MQRFFLLALVVSFNVYAKMPCKPRAGAPYPWEGSGMCTGNTQLEIPLPTLEMSLTYNSEAPNADFGFGNAGWKLSVDDRLQNSDSGSIRQLELADGTIYPYLLNGTVWTPQHLGITRTKVSFGSANPNGLWEAKDGIFVKFGSQATVNTDLNLSPPPSSALFVPAGSIQSGTVGRLSNPPETVLNVFGSISISDLNGVKMQITRDSKNHITGLENAYGQKLLFTLSSGYTTQIKDFAGGTYSFRYDNSGRLSAVVYPDNSRWEIRYHEDTEKNEYLVWKLTEPSNEASQFVYATNTSLPASDASWTPYLSPVGGCDDSGAVGVVCSILGVESKYLYRYVYNPFYVSVAGQTGIRRELFYDNGSLLQESENGVQIDYVRNAYYMPTIITDTTGRSTYFTYDARMNVLTYKDVGGVVTSFEYDANDELTKVSSPFEVFTITYDSKRLPTKVSSSAGVTLLIQRDGAGNPLSITENGRKVFQATFDANGNVVTRTDSTGLTSTYAYNKGYLTSYTDGLGFQVGITRNPIGLPLSLQMPGGMSRTRSYDSMGRLTSDSLTGPSGESITYSAIYTGGFVSASNKQADEKKSREAAMQFSRLLASLTENKSYADNGAASKSFSCSNGPSGKDDSERNGKAIANGGCAKPKLDYGTCIPMCGAPGIVICPGQPKPKCYCGPNEFGGQTCCEDPNGGLCRKCTNDYTKCVDKIITVWPDYSGW